MKNLLALVGFAVLVFLGLGYYMEWYSVSSRSDNFEIDVNEKKIVDDADAAKRKVGNVVHDVAGGSKKATP